MKQLITNLEQQKTILHELSTLLLEERDAIISNDSTLLIELLQNKEDYQAALNALEQNRLLLSGEQTLNQIAESADEKDRRLLLSLAEELKNKIRELHSINDTNMILLKHNLAYFSHLRKTLVPEQRFAPYDKKGYLRQSADNILISKLA